MSLLFLLHSPSSSRIIFKNASQEPSSLILHVCAPHLCWSAGDPLSLIPHVAHFYSGKMKGIIVNQGNLPKLQAQVRTDEKATACS